MQGHVFVVHGKADKIARTAAPSQRDGDACRERPLAVRTLESSGRHAADELRVTVEQLIRESQREGSPDVALITPDLATFTAAQSLRRRLMPLDAQSTDHLEVIRDLARRATRGELVVFMGAGVSAAAGVPEWRALLEALAGEAGLDEGARAQLGKLPLIDQAALIEARFCERTREGRSALRRVLAKLVSKERASLAHHLLAGLPSRQFVTTNYDALFELACAGTGRALSILPHARTNAERWLLKLHGCVERPDEIVFTREDYLRYEQRHVALAGVVQALLFTQHVLFVGFSLNDDNFHKMADAVRRAGGSSDANTPEQTFGTALVLEDEPLRRELWRRDLRWVSMHDGREVCDAPCLARRCEIFLDRVLSESWRAGPHLLDDRYDALLDDDEREIKRALQSLLQRVDGATRERAADTWRIIAHAARALGG